MAIPNIDKAMLPQSPFLMEDDDAPIEIDIGDPNEPVETEVEVDLEKQPAFDANPDGAIGRMTLQAVEAQPVNQLIKDLCARRLAYMKSLPTWSTYGRGWERRVIESEQLALKIADHPSGEVPSN